MSFLTDIDDQEIRNDQIDTAHRNPSFDAVVFSQSDIRKKDFLQFVFLRNEDLVSCYQNAAQRIRGSGQKKLLTNMLQRRKDIKKKILQNLGKSEGQTGRAADGVVSSVMKYILDTDLKPVNSIIDVFMFISKKEQNEFELFSRLADLEENREIKEIFLEHARHCKEHIRLLETDFAELTLENSVNIEDQIA